MNPDGQFATSRQVFLFQATMSSVILAMTAVTILAGNYLVDHDHWLRLVQREQWKSQDAVTFQGGARFDRGFYASGDDRFFHGVLPDADFSHGGAYLVGSSIMHFAVDPMDMMAAEPEHIFNYGQPGQTFTQENQFIHYLVEEADLLRAGKEKTAIVFGLSFNDITHRWTIDPQGYWRKRMESDYYFHYNVEGGLHADKHRLSGALARLRLTLFRSKSFWYWVYFQMKVPTDSQGAALVGPPADPAAYWMEKNGQQWEQGLTLEMAQFRSLLDYLKDHQIKAGAIYLPEKTWCKAFAPAQQYRHAVLELLAKEGIPVVDLINLLPDQDFIDASHTNYLGDQILGPMILKTAHDMLTLDGVSAH